MGVLALIRDAATQLVRELRASDGDLLLYQDPTTALGAATKQYVDARSGTTGNVLFTDNNQTTYPNQGGYIAWNVTGGSGETDFVNNLGGGAGGFNWYNTTTLAGTALTELMSLNAIGQLSILADPTSALQVATKQYVDNAQEIFGLELVWVSPTSVSCRPGRCYIPGLGRSINVNGQTLTGISSSSNSILHYYINNTGALLSSTTAPIAYSGTAYEATGNANWRYVGSTMSITANTIVRFMQRGSHMAFVAASPTVFNGSNMSTTWTSVTAAALLLPGTSLDVDLRLNNAPNATASSNICVSNADAGFSSPAAGFLGTMTYGTSGYYNCPLSAAGSFQYGLSLAQSGTPNTVVIMLNGYNFSR